MKLGVLDFFKDVFNFLKAGSVLGVDIGTSSIKIAEVSAKGEHFELENYGVLESKKYLNQANQAIQSSSLPIIEKDAIKLMQIILNEVRPKTKVAMVSIPSFTSFVVPIDMPIMSLEETSKSIMFQAKQYIPIPIDQVTLDWVKVEETDTGGIGTQKIILVGTPTEIVKRYKRIFKAVGLELKTLEVEGFALGRALVTEKPTLVVDIGAESTNIIVTEKGVLKQYNQSDYGGIYLTQALSRSLGISAARAEELKRRRGLLATGGEAELSTLILPFLDVIIQEVRYVRDEYARRYSKGVDEVMLVGGGANLLGIEKYVQNELGLRVVSPSTLNNVVYKEGLEPALKILKNELVLPVGLAKKYFQK
ncbi:MAG: type IV pilus assembly protein PilM [Patescibacteria group bacterium]